MTPPDIVCLLGIPGSGKGTIGKKLASDFDFYHLSVGDHLREEHGRGRFEKDSYVLDCLKQGKLLPASMLLPILSKKIEETAGKDYRAIILDGFPRCLSQGQQFEGLVRNVAVVIQLNCPREIAKRRFLDRKLPGRLHQDDEAMFTKRVSEFEQENDEIAHFYRQKNMLFEIDSSGDTEMTYQRLLDTINQDGRWAPLLDIHH
ncbi:hypothetical protein MMC12_008720 [Toensbergia leucococca]|nr:hypothetical protein [Toensbergia leucococca]